VYILVRIESLDIKGFGRLANMSLILSSGINIISGSNESGKSTLQSFIKAMFYGLAGGRQSKDGTPPPLKSFRPWHGENYGGSLDYMTDDGNRYRIVRNFNNNTVKIYDASFNDITSSFEAGRDKSPKFAETHTGLSEKCFDSTIFIKQMSLKTTDDRDHELYNRLLNISRSGMEDVSFIRACQALNDAQINYVGTERSSKRPLDLIIHELERLSLQKQSLVFKRRNQDSVMEKLDHSRKLMENLKSREACLKKSLSRYKITESCKNIVTKKQSLLKLHDRIADEEERLSEIIRSSDGIDEKHISDSNAELLRDADLKRQELLKLETGLSGVHNGKRKYLHSIITSGIVFSLAVVLFLIIAMYTGALPYASLASSLIWPAGVLFIFFAAADVYCRIRALYRKSSAFEGTKYNEILRLKTSLFEIEQKYSTGIHAISSLSLLRERREDAVSRINELLRESENICRAVIKDKSDILLQLRRLDEDENALRNSLDELDKNEDVLKNSLEELDKEVTGGDELQDLSGNIERQHLSGDTERRDLSRNAEQQDLSDIYLDALDKTVSLISEEALKIKEYETLLREYDDNSDLLQETEEEIELLSLRKISLEETGLALQKALEILTLCSENIQKIFSPQLNAVMSPIAARLTGGRYSDLRINDSLSPVTVDSDTGDTVGAGLLSAGTADQIYLAMRLALAEIVGKPGETLPIIMDEAFSQFDDNRLVKALEYIKEKSIHTQVLIFTCSQIELDIMKTIFGEVSTKNLLFISLP